MIRSLLRPKTFDLILLALGIACLGKYGYNASQINPTSAVGAPLAHFESGNALRKSIGNPNFAAIHPRDAIYNRDVIWVESPPDSYIIFLDGSRMRIKAGSLIVVRRSLRGVEASGRVEVIVGEVEFHLHWAWPWEATDYEVYSSRERVPVQDQNPNVTVNTEEPTAKPRPVPTMALGEIRASASPSPSPSPIPAPSPSASAEEAKNETDPAAPAKRKNSEVSYIEANSLFARPAHPRPGSILLKLRGQSSVITFNWTKPGTGTLEVTAASGKSYGPVSFTSTTNTKLELPTDQEYTWKLVLNSQPEIAPAKFSLYSVKTHPLSQIIESQTKAVVEMIP